MITRNELAMKETDQELLSKMLDEEVSKFEMQRILREMQSSFELRAKFQRYNIIGHAMRGQLPARLNYNFLDDVMNELSSEVKPGSGSNESGRDSANTKIKTAISFAVAASVAVVSFIAFQNLVQPDKNIDSATVVAEQAAEENSVQYINEEKLHDFISSPEAAEEFNSYFVNHVEYASPRASMPHVRIIGYGRIQPEKDN